jgi:hypothetical protein
MTIVKTNRAAKMLERFYSLIYLSDKKKRKQLGLPFLVVVCIFKCHCFSYCDHKSLKKCQQIKITFMSQPELYFILLQYSRNLITELLRNSYGKSSENQLS